MKEIKEKFMSAIKAIDFSKLSINDLSALASATEKIKTLDADPNEYAKLLSKGLGNGFGGPPKETLKDLR